MMMMMMMMMIVFPMFFVLIVVHIFGGSLHFLCLSWLAVFKWKSALGLSQNGQVTW